MPVHPFDPTEPARAKGGVVWPEGPERLVGHTLAERYRLGKPIGFGGMGTVFLAEHVLIKKRVAIKVLGAEHGENRSEIERFLREAQAASRIRHEHVVDITDFGSTDDGLVFLVMEHLEGEDLATTCEREGAMPWRRAAMFVLQIAAALEAAHARGVIHRDMKPENCFRLRRGDDPDFIKVLDFGIAKLLDEREAELSTSGSGLLGTPEYIAPELVRGQKADVRVDIYAVGVIFYRLLAGRVPFYGESFMATLTAHLMEPPKPPSQVVPDAEIPPQIEAIVMHALAKDPDQRYPTIAAFVAALKAAIVAEASPVPAPVLPVGRGIHPQVALAVVVALIVSFAAVLWYVVGTQRENEPVTVAETEPVTPVVSAASSPTPAAESSPAPVVAGPVLVAPVVVGPVEAPEAAGPVEDAPDEDAPDEDAPDEGQALEPNTGAPAPAPSAAARRQRAARERQAADEFAAAMVKVAPRVKLECSRFALRKMEVTVTVKVGVVGNVSASPTGSQAGSTLGNCVARVVGTVHLSGKRARSTYRHTFTM